jgi:hypothetical protein
MFEDVVTIELAPLVALFLFLSAIAHFYISSPGAYQWYLKNIKKGINYVRWIEYAISSSVMIIVIAMLTGIFNLWLIVAIFGLNAIMNLMGMMMEVHNQTTENTNWLAYIIGCIAGIIPWIIIAAYFFGSINQTAELNADFLPEDEQPIPEFVYAILLSIFVFFNSFALNMFLQYKKVGPWKNYVFGEKMYIVLSLVAKTALAWQIFFGTLRPF